MKSLLYKSRIEWKFAIVTSVCFSIFVLVLGLLFPTEIRPLRVIAISLGGLWGYELLFGDGKPRQEEITV